MNSSKNSPISDLIAPLKSSISQHLFESVRRDLCIRESRYDGEKNLLLHKLKKISSDHDILEKQFRQVKTEYGNLILRDGEKSCELSELRRQLGELRAENESKTRDHAELVKQLTESRLELKQMKHSASELRVENEELGKKLGETASFEEEIRVWKEKYEAAMKEVAAAEEKARREKEVVVSENVKLKMTKDAVVDAAINKFRCFDKRVATLEGNLAALKVTIHSSGQPVVSTVPDKELRNSFGTNAKHEALLRCKTKPSSKPSFTEKYSSASITICISDSDDDGEAKGLKRKRGFNSSSDHSKTPLTPKPSQQKNSKSDNNVEVESVDSSAKRWESEADMVRDLEKNPEICMRAICALYRQHMNVGESKGFSEVDAFRGKILGNFLVNGDIHGGVKKSVAKLVEYDRDGPNKCRRIAMDHSSRLFEIYKNKEDPHFAPPH
ncbi:hypothetical protein RND81_06G247800 [Saponaria officinalis]|uniref:FRIGIDA-like protein n=1 Tax=Saponaria officinalis TaxID=3572 RepID=A0AAW1KDN8_SAPOF